MDTIDWNDLRYLLAVARGGSAAAAARALGVSNATVLRRVQVAEQSIGSPLFERLATGYVVTEAGRTLTDAAHAIDAAITDARRLIEGRAAELSGTVRFTTTDSLGCTVMPALLASFHERYPAIKVEMLMTNSLLDLDKRDADVTLRPSAHPPQAWFGMRLVRMDFAVYASAAYLAARLGTPWAEFGWLMPEGTLDAAPASRWLRSMVASERAVLSVDSFIALSLLATNGTGAALLPRFVAASVPNLELIEAAPHSASVDVWVLTHTDLKQAARINAFMTHVAQGIRDARSLFEANEASAP
jgi:molybdate transport repressor ModE-like protein